MTTVLCVLPDSVYKSLDCDTYDQARNAWTFNGPGPVVAHPPCRTWGRLRHFAHPNETEHALAVHCLNLVRQFGGVLEHPAGSSLWQTCHLPRPGKIKNPMAYSICVDQFVWGHRAQKATWLYIVGCPPRRLPPIPFTLRTAQCVIATSRSNRAGSPGHRPEVSKHERSATPLPFANWLLAVAARADHPD